MVEQINTINGIPVYNAVFDDDNCRLDRVSLVDYPAILSDFQTYAKVEVPQMYSIIDNDKHLVRGCVMRADFPIIRVDAYGNPFYVIFTKEEIRKMAEKYLVEGRQNKTNLMHEDGEDSEGVYMLQWFLKDTAKGINPVGYEDISDGSLFAEYHITNPDIWEGVKNGTYKGFSIEVFNNLAPNTDLEGLKEIERVNNGKFSKNMAKLKKLAEALMSEILKGEEKYSATGTDKGVLHHEEDLAEGVKVTIEDAEGNEVIPEDGEYKTDDKVIVVEGGEVKEIKDAEVIADEEKTEEVAEDGEKTEEVDAVVEEVIEEVEETTPEETETEVEEDNVLENRIATLEEEIKNLKDIIAGLAKGADLEELNARVEKLSKMPVAEPAHDTVKDIAPSDPLLERLKKNRR